MIRRKTVTWEERYTFVVSAGVQDHPRQCNKTPHKQVDRLIDRQQTNRQMDRQTEEKEEK